MAIKLSRGEGKIIVAPTQEAVMKPRIEITKNIPEAELEKVMDYILSIK